MYSCCCIDVDSEPGFRAFPTIRVARIEHKCNECSAVIAPGERYESVKCLDTYSGAGRKWDTHKTCWFCLKVRNDYFECGWYYGMLREDFEECNGWDYAGPAGQFDDDDEEEIDA